MSETKEHIYSITQIQDYLKCPYYYKKRYVDKEIPPKNEALIVGSCIHRALEYNFKNKMHSKEDKPPVKVADNFAEEMKTQKDEISWTTGFQKQLDIGRNLIIKYMKDYAPTIKPLAVEQVFTIDLPISNCKFKGYVDLITESHEVIDHKTAGKTPHPITLKKYELQLTSYAIGLQYLNPQTMNIEVPDNIQKVLAENKTVNTRIDILMKTDPPKIIPKSYPRTSEDYYYLINLVNTVVKAIENNDFYPQPLHMLCDQKYCEFYNDCENNFRRKLNDG